VRFDEKGGERSRTAVQKSLEILGFYHTERYIAHYNEHDERLAEFCSIEYGHKSIRLADSFSSNGSNCWKIGRVPVSA